MNDDNEITIPIEVEAGQYAEVSVQLTSGIASVLSDDDVVAAVRNNVELDDLSRELKRMSHVKAKQ